MKKLSLFILAQIILLLSLSCDSPENVYSIDGYFEAYFPGQPSLYYSGDNEFLTFQIYNYDDEYDNIQYVAAYGILKKIPEDNKNFLYSYIYAMIEGWGGNLLKYELIEHEGNDEILYVTESERAYQLVYEFGIAAIKGNNFYQWVVEEREDMSEADKIFGEKLKFFKVLN